MSPTTSRRTLLRRAAAGGLVAWTAPVIATAHSPVAAAAGSACAPKITRQWNPFDVGPVGTVVVSRTLGFGKGGGFLDVTDAYLTGDVFTVAVDGTSCGDTSPAPNLGAGVWTDDPDVAFADPRWSSRRFWIAPDVHSFTITVAVNPWGSGGGFWRIGLC